MTRQQYLDAAIRLFLETPGAPDKPTRRDWAIAGDLYRSRVSLCTLAHAMRLATLRRSLACDQDPIRSLAYYRAVLRQLTRLELDPGYVDYVRHRYQLLRDSAQHETAPTKPQSRASS